MSITSWIIVFIVLCIYLYPTTIAINEKKNNLFLIMFINGVFGLTIVWWITALVIAKKSWVREKKTTVKKDNEFVSKLKEMNTWDYWLKK